MEFVSFELAIARLLYDNNFDLRKKDLTSSRLFHILRSYRDTNIYIEKVFLVTRVILQGNIFNIKYI